MCAGARGPGGPGDRAGVEGGGGPRSCSKCLAHRSTIEFSESPVLNWYAPSIDRTPAGLSLCFNSIIYNKTKNKNKNREKEIVRIANQPCKIPSYASYLAAPRFRAPMISSVQIASSVTWSIDPRLLATLTVYTLFPVRDSNMRDPAKAQSF